MNSLLQFVMSSAVETLFTFHFSLFTFYFLLFVFNEQLASICHVERSRDTFSFLTSHFFDSGLQDKSEARLQDSSLITFTFTLYTLHFLSPTRQLALSLKMFTEHFFNALPSQSDNTQILFRLN